MADHVFTYKHGWIKIGGTSPTTKSADKIAAANGRKGGDLAHLKSQADKLGPHSKAAQDYAAALASKPSTGKVTLAGLGKSLPSKNTSSAHKIAEKVNAPTVPPVKAKAAAVTAEHKKGSLEGLSSAQLGALKLYTGDDYKGINGGLRKGTVPARYEKTVANMDSALASKPLAAPTKVWRTVGGGAFGLSHGSDASSLKGKVFSEAGFMSTSTTNQRFPVTPPPVHITVEVPAGVGAAYLESITKNKTENELLLPRNLRYVVTNVRYSSAKGGWTATARVLPPAGAK